MRRTNVKVSPTIDEDDFGSIDNFLAGVNSEVDELVRSATLEVFGESSSSGSEISGRAHASTPSSGAGQFAPKVPWVDDAARAREELRIFGDENGDDDDSDEGEEGQEEIKLAHEVEDDTNIKELEQNLKTLEKQTTVLREKYTQYIEVSREKEDLKLKAEELEDELDEMHKDFAREVDMRGLSGLGDDMRFMSMSSGIMGAGQGSSTEASGMDSAAMEAEIRAQLMKVDDTEDMSHLMESEGKSISWRQRLEAYIEDILPFRKDIRQVEARFGTAVGAYLSFYRWIYLQFCVLAFIALICSFYHVSSMLTREKEVKFIDVFSVETSRIWPLMNFMRYQSFNEDEKFPYIIAVVMLNVALVFNAIAKLIREDYRRRLTMEVSNEEEQKYSQAILCAWDNNLGTKAESDDLSGAISQNLILLISETRAAGAVASRNNLELLILYTRRFFANVSFFIIIIGSAAIIMAVARIGEGDSIFSLPAVVVLAINSITPPALEFLTDFEQWDSGDVELSIMTFRVYLSSTINLIVLVGSKLLLLSSDNILAGEQSMIFLNLNVPSFFSSVTFGDIRTRLKILRDRSVCDRMEATAYEAFGQVMSEAAGKAVFFLIGGEYPRIMGYLYWITGITNGDWIREEVKIAELTVANIFSAGLVMVTMPFSPLSVIYAPIVWYVNFKAEKWIIINYYGKPKKEIRGSKSGTIFAYFYLFTVLFICLPVTLYFLLNVEFYGDKEIDPKCEKDDPDYNKEFDCFCTSANYDKFGDSRGPFYQGDEANGLDVFDIIFEYDNTGIAESIWKVFVETNYGAWALFTFFIVEYCFAKNAAKVTKEAHQGKERLLENLVAQLRMNVSKKTAVIRKLKSIGKEEESESDGESVDSKEKDLIVLPGGQ